MLTPEARPRFLELLDRLTQPGPKAAGVSASEIHEVVDLAHEALATIDMLEVNAMTEAEVDQEIRDAGGDPDEIARRGQRMVDQILAERRKANGSEPTAKPSRPQVWLWRAWSAERDRLCDCGTATGATKADAIALAQRCMGGTWAHLVTLIEAELITGRYDD